MLHQEPEYLSICGLLKARPATEGNERVLYMEASNETTDLQGEKVLAKSLAESASHFLRYGNIDLDHRTLLPPRHAGDNPYVWEIGQPVAATVEGGRTFVKAVLYQGDGETARNANMVWDSLTRLSPPARWYPSVGGQILERGSEIDPLTKAQVNLVTKVRWTNIGLSRTPVNQSVPSVTPIPLEVFAKCCTVNGFNLCKALEAGYGTDVAQLNDGAALRRQSLDHHTQSLLPQSYLDLRESLAAAIRRGDVSPQPDALAHLMQQQFSIPALQAAEWTARFLSDLARHRR